MSIQINGNGSVTGISVGGLPDGIVDTDMIAASAASPEKLGDNIVIQTSIVGTPNNVTVNSDGSYTDIITHTFTPKRSATTPTPKNSALCPFFKPYAIFERISVFNRFID